MAAYEFAVEERPDETTLRTNFGEAATGDVVVRDAYAALGALDLQGGRLLRINGAASLPVAMVIAHAVSHRYGAVAMFDPKIQGYIVAISHDPEWTVGDVLNDSKGDEA